ncbi:unnamed protein product [Allacma fusca]|uniref:Polycystin cation channel PKD1/PKD2 domain-containing protein n=1 Tax=Allacma fusca TaxID=39272 RepID=A0A8J2LJF3_9HEXA|nr:unnamed protein product [Allacma fusca]
MFGAQVRDFSTFMDSVFALLRLILGDFDFREIEAANRVLGPIYFIAYIFFVFFVLLNMFLAIINDTFGEVKAELQARGHEFEIVDYFKRGFNNMCGWCGRKNEAMDAKYAVQLASADGVITYDELRQNLRDNGFTDMEIEMFLARYELDHHRPLDEDEIQHLLRKLEGKEEGMKDGNPTYSSSDYISQQVYQQEVEALDQRVTAMEVAISNVIHKIDTMVNKLQRGR